jgi:hypothetical protein
LWWLPGWTFAAITQAPAVLAVAWLIPGAGMLLADRLLPLPMVIIFVPLALALCYFAMRRLPASWPRPGVAGEAAAARSRPDVPAAAVLAMVVIAAGFGVWQAVLRSEQVFVASDPGVYLQYGYWIAEHGTARIPVSAASFGGSGGLDYATPGFIVSGGSITPGYLPGLPLLLAAGTWLGGLGGALLMPAVLGGCAVLSFGGLVGRLCGAWWAVAGELMLAICLPEVYASRTPFSEPLVQVLLFGGLCLFLDSLVVRRRGVGGDGGGRHGRPGKLDGELALAGLAGLALGLTVLASIGSLGMLLPAFPVIAVLFVARRPQAGPFGCGLILGIGSGLTAGLVLARPYLASVSEQLHLIGLSAAAFGAVTVLIAPLAFPGAPARMRRACAVRLSFPWFKGERVVLPSLGFMLAGLALVLPVVVLAGLAVRPYLQTVRGQTNPAMIRQVAALQRLERLPVDGTRRYFESSLSWVLWYLGVPALLLACLGTAALGRRLVQAVLSPRSGGPGGGADVSSGDSDDSGDSGVPSDLGGSDGEALWLWGLPFLIIAWSVLTVLWDPAVVPWQPLASRRLVAVVLPGLVLLAVWASARLTARAAGLGASRTVVGLVAACCVLALAIPPLVTTFNPGLAAKPSVGRYSSGLAKLLSRARLLGLGTSATYGGSLAAASSLCAAIGPSASVVFVDEQLAQTFAPVVRGLCGQPAASMVPGATSKASLADAVNLIEQLGRRPVLVGPSGAAVSLPGITPRLAVSLRTSGDAEVLTGPPAGTWSTTYTLWLAAPSGT